MRPGQALSSLRVTVDPVRESVDAAALIAAWTQKLKTQDLKESPIQPFARELSSRARIGFTRNPPVPAAIDS